MVRVKDRISVIENGDRHFGTVTKVSGKDCYIDFDDGDDGIYNLEELVETQISCEKELRKFVKRFGGFRKGVSEADKARAHQMLKLLGRKELRWDKSLIPFLSEQRGLV